MKQYVLLIAILYKKLKSTNKNMRKKYDINLDFNFFLFYVAFVKKLADIASK
jgi:hypothetical protein